MVSGAKVGFLELILDSFFFKEAPHGILIKVSVLMVLHFKFDSSSVFSKPSCAQEKIGLLVNKLD